MAYQQPQQGNQGYPHRPSDPSNPFGSSTQALGGQYSAGNSYEGGESDEYQSNQYSAEDEHRQRESRLHPVLRQGRHRLNFDQRACAGQFRKTGA